jgi:hypothetical protein
MARYVSIVQGVSRLLLDHGTDATAQDVHTQTLSHRASSMKASQRLLDYGADATAQDNGLPSPKPDTISGAPDCPSHSISNRAARNRPHAYRCRYIDHPQTTERPRVRGRWGSRTPTPPHPRIHIRSAFEPRCQEQYDTLSAAQVERHQMQRTRGLCVLSYIHPITLTQRPAAPG